MSRRRPSKEIQFTSYDDLLGINESSEIDTSKIIEVPLSELYPFKDHPFYVRDDEKMEETVESIRNYGVLNPGLVRPRAGGGYEIIAGHRRKRGSELAGKNTMPVIIRDYSDDEAVIIMVDSNIQRENILPSEKAFAYRMKMEAMKHQGISLEDGADTATEIGSKAGDSKRQVHRYIRLTYLNTEFLELVDNGKIAFTAGVTLSYIDKADQKELWEFCRKYQILPNPDQSMRLRDCSKEGSLTEAVMKIILCEKKEVSKKVVLKQEKLEKYFEDSISQREMEEIILGLLEEWHKRNQNGV